MLGLEQVHFWPCYVYAGSLCTCAICLVMAVHHVVCCRLQGGPAELAGGEDSAWALPMGAALLGVRHVGLGGWQPHECMAVENELSAWQRLGELSSRDNALRYFLLHAAGSGACRDLLTHALQR